MKPGSHHNGTHDREQPTPTHHQPGREPPTHIRVLFQPLPVRILHWSFCLSVTVLTATGLYISYPLSLGPWFTMRDARFLHREFAFVSLAVVAIRLYYAFATGDYLNFAFCRGDGARAVQMLRYLLFLRESPPRLDKYNVFQKLLFLSWLVVYLLEAAVGAILMSPPTYVGLLRPVGGAQGARFLAYLGALWFLLTVPGHVYLAVTEDPGKLQAIFSGELREKT